MRNGTSEQRHNGTRPAARLAQPGNLPADKAHWFVRVKCWLAHVERRLEPVDQIDYLIRRFLLGPVTWSIPTRAGSGRASIGAEFGGRGPALRGIRQVFGDELMVS